jgi:hypothetical protein
VHPIFSSSALTVERTKRSTIRSNRKRILLFSNSELRGHSIKSRKRESTVEINQVFRLRLLNFTRKMIHSSSSKLKCSRRERKQQRRLEKLSTRPTHPTWFRLPIRSHCNQVLLLLPSRPRSRARRVQALRRAPAAPRVRRFPAKPPSRFISVSVRPNAAVFSELKFHGGGHSSDFRPAVPWCTQFSHRLL